MLNEPIVLPCGARIANRLVKAAMTEGLADPAGVPTPELARLYRAWARGGAGMMLTGNVIVVPDHLERPGNVIIDRAPSGAMLAALRAWATAGTVDGNHLWMQINHPGRQTQKNVNPAPKAPSAVKVALPGNRFGMPVPLTETEIADIVARFARAAAVAREAGFTGVQVHAAHGYLLSQFLSPLANRRTDQYGGSLQNRARLLLDIVAATRATVGADFPISVKLNSADFQRGGFAFEDSLTVARWLEAAGVDLLEISGGSYEQPAMMDMPGLEPPDAPAVATSTAAREAYFVDFAKAMKAELNTMPLMVTGGFRTRAAMAHALESGAADMVGIARPLCAEPDSAAAVLSGAASLSRPEDQLTLFPRWLGVLAGTKLGRALSGFGVQMWYYAQIDHVGRTGTARAAQSVFSAMRQVERQQKAWLAARGAR